jgi:hypothetical protein
VQEAAVSDRDQPHLAENTGREEEDQEEESEGEGEEEEADIARRAAKNGRAPRHPDHLPWSIR